MIHTRDFYPPSTPANRFRAARMTHVSRMVDRILLEKGTCSIIDIGGLPNYWRCFAPGIINDQRVKITIVNRSYEGDPTASLSASERRAITIATGDARRLEGFADKSFDLAHSNSVIEHVGRWDDICAMALETQRVSRRHFVQTPYWGFPVEPHNRTPLFHWLPEQARYRLVMRFNLGFWTKALDVDAAMKRVESIVLLDRRQFGVLFPASSIYSEIAWGMTKSLIAIGGDGIEVNPLTNTRRLRT